MGKKYIIAIGIVLMVLCLTGCNGAKETDQIGYVLVLGLDKGQGDKVNVTYQIAKTAAIGGPSESGNRTSVSLTFSVRSIGEARNLLDSAIALAPAVYHVKAIVFGEELARSGIGDILGPIMRFREYRGSAFMIITKGTAQEFIKHNTPIFNLSQAKYVELMMENSIDTGFYPASTLHNFYLRLKENTASPYAVLAAINDEQLSRQSHAAPLPDRKEQIHLPGTIERKGGSSLEFVGTALFRRDKLVGMLNSNETRALLLLLGQVENGFVSVSDPLAPDKQVSVRIKSDGHPQITTQIVDERPIIRIEQNVEGYITSNNSGINYENPEYGGLLESRLSQVLTEDMTSLIRTSQSANSDVIGLGFYMTRHFATMQQFKDFDWQTRYTDADIQVVVNAKVKRYGLMWKTNPIKKRR